MKLRSIQLTNFRKFVGTVGVDGITDGVNLLVGENESGKRYDVWRRSTV